MLYPRGMRSSIFLALIAILTCLPDALVWAQEPTAAAPYLASGPRELFSKGVELADRGAAEEAKTIFKALTLAYPDLPEPHINLAVLLADSGGTEESAEEIEAAMRAHPLCRAAFDLEFQRRMGPYSTTLLGTTTPPPVAESPAGPALAARARPQPAEQSGLAAAVRVVLEAADPCLNFRPEPSAGSAALECLPPGTRVRWLETAGDWSRVALRNGREGWMASSFLAPPDP